MTSRSRSPADQVERLLSAIEPDHRRRKVRDSLDAHFDAPGVRDRRGRRSGELKKAATTLRHIVGMQRWVLDSRYELNVRKRIRDFLRHIDHRQPWPRTAAECRKARGLANGAARSRNERTEYGPGEPAALAGAHTIVPLNSVAKMRSAGRRGRNCLRNNELGYWDDLRRGEAEFHEVRESGIAVAWLRVDREYREIAEVQGPDNTEADLPADVLWELCRKLDVHGDGEELFLGNGVLSIFLNGAARPATPSAVVGGYRIWSRTGEIVVHDPMDDRWSRFLWRAGGWRADGASHLETNAFELMRRLEPAVASLARAARPTRLRSRGRPRRRHRRVPHV